MGTQTADSCSETCSLIATAWSTLSILRQPHAECMRCCLHSVADVDGNHVVACGSVGEDGKPASPVVASLAVLANGELLRKTSSGLSVMLGRGQLEAREGLHQASSAQAHLENFAEHFTCHHVHLLLSSWDFMAQALRQEYGSSAAGHEQRGRWWHACRGEVSSKARSKVVESKVIESMENGTHVGPDQSHASISGHQPSNAGMLL